MVEPQFTIGDVPCNGCTRCCHGDAVRLLPADDAASYETAPHDHYPGQLMLAHKANGECIYLTPTGCGIHPRRPQMCREMDCRLLAMRISFTEARKMKHFPITVWWRGKELLKSSEKSRPSVEVVRKWTLIYRLKPSS